MYEGDNPLAERRAAALSLDQGLLAELLGRAELRELLDPAVLAAVELELQRLDPERRARGLEGVADLVRLIGPLSTAEVAARVPDESAEEAEGWLLALAEARRVVQVRVAGEPRWAAVEDVPRLRDGLGVPVPPGTPNAFLDEVTDPLADLVGRYARCHGPFTVSDVAERWGLGSAVVRQTLLRLAGSGRVVEGEFRPTGSGSEWCDAEVLRRLRRRSLAALRKEVEPVEPATLGRFLPAWQNVIIDQPEEPAGQRNGRSAGGSPALASLRAPRRRRGAVGGRAARGLRRAGQRPGDAGAAEPDRGLHRRLPRRAHRDRRGHLGRSGHAAGQGRLGVDAPRRQRPPHPARADAVRRDAAAPRRHRRPRGRRRLLLPSAQQRRRVDRRHRHARRAVGPGVVRAG